MRYIINLCDAKFYLIHFELIYIVLLFEVPEEVENLQFDDISDRALTVKWNPPKEINGVLMCYQLKYMIKDLPESLKSENFTADIQSTKVEHLQVIIFKKLKLHWYNFIYVIKYYI